MIAFIVPAMYIDLIIYLFGACAVRDKIIIYLFGAREVRARNYEIIQNRSAREIL